MKNLKAELVKKILSLKKERRRIENHFKACEPIEKKGLKALEDFTRGELSAWQSCLELVEKNESGIDNVRKGDIL